MKELLRTNNPVLVSWVTALLADRGIDAILLDSHTAILEGSIGAIPRRIMVADDDHGAARRALADAGIEAGG